jgi:hypothetical protein
MKLSVYKLSGYSGLLLLCGLSTAYAQWPSLSWAPREDLNVLLPGSIRMYEANGTLADGARIRAVYAVVDLRDHNLNLHAVGSNIVRQTTREAYDQHHAILAVNAGYFSATASVSLLVSDGQTIAPGPKNGVPRGAFGLVDGKPEIAWPLAVDTVKNILFQYTDPHTPETPRFTASTPGGVLWKPSQAVGGGPMLVKAGKIRDTSKEEGFGESHLKRHPRTAIGYRDENTVVVMVVDGRQVTSAGVTIVELAQLMLAVGCREAVNLDGGGSSAMVAADEIVNIPVDKPKGNRYSLRKNASALVWTEVKPAAKPVMHYIDTDCPAFTETGLWRNTKNVNSYGKTPAHVDSAATGALTPRNKADYQFKKIKKGVYQLAAWWTVDTVNTRHAAYVLHHGSKTDTLTVDQRDLSGSGKWNVLGNYKLVSGDHLELVNKDNGGRLVADAVRLVMLLNKREEVDGRQSTVHSKR